MPDHRIFSERYVKMDEHLAALEYAALNRFLFGVENFAYGLIIGSCAITIVVMLVVGL